MPQIQDYGVVGAWLCLVIGALLVAIACMPAKLWDPLWPGRRLYRVLVAHGDWMDERALCWFEPCNYWEVPVRLRAHLLAGLVEFDGRIRWRAKVSAAKGGA